MKSCSNCGASNADSMRFCGACGAALGALDETPSAPPVAVAAGAGRVAATVDDGRAPLTAMAARVRTLMATKAEGPAFLAQGQRKADILFVLDCTGSMRGEIETIKSCVTDFADTISSQGVRARVGLVEFRDRLYGEEHRAITFDGQPFTADPGVFRRQIDGLRASGGGPEPESSLDALMLAASQPFAPDASKVIVLITDAPPHIPDKDTRSVEAVADRLREIGIHQVYLVIRTSDPRCHVYLKLLEGTRGLAFELGKGNDFSNRAEHFKKTLMQLGKTISSATV